MSSGYSQIFEYMHRRMCLILQQPQQLPEATTYQPAPLHPLEIGTKVLTNASQAQLLAELASRLHLHG